MSDSTDNNLREFERQLARLLSEHVVSLRPEQLADALQDHAEQMQPGTCRHLICRHVNAKGGASLEIAITYTSARALELDIPQILEIGALVVQCPLDVELLTQARVLIGAKNVPQALTFSGKIVNNTKAGLALQLDAADARARDALLSWPDRMRGLTSPQTPGQPAAALAPDSEVMVSSPLRTPSTQESEALGHGNAHTEACESSSPAKSPAQKDKRDRPRVGHQRAPRAKATQQQLPKQPNLRSKSSLFDTSWDLSQTSLSEVVGELVARSGRGILELSNDERRVQMLVADGNLYEIQASPISAKFSLGVYLQRKGRIRAELAHQLFGQVESNGITEAQALLQRPDDLSRRSAVAAIRSHLSRIFVHFDADDLVQARYFTSGSAQIGQTATCVPLARLMYLRAKIACRDDPSSLDKRFSRSDFRCAAWPSIAVDDLGLNPAERQLLDFLLAEARSLNQLIERSPLGPAETVGALAGFEATGLLEWELDELGVADTAGLAKGNKMSAETIDAICMLVSKSDDPFELLGLHWTTYDAEIERRYDRLRHLIRDINMPVGLDHDRRRRIKSVRKQLREAHDKIYQSHLRQQYRDQHLSERRQQSVADELETLADQAMNQRKFASSLDFYQRLLELVPEHGRAGSLLPKLLVRVQQAH